MSGSARAPRCDVGPPPQPGPRFQPSCGRRESTGSSLASDQEADALPAPVQAGCDVRSGHEIVRFDPDDAAARDGGLHRADGRTDGLGQRGCLAGEIAELNPVDLSEGCVPATRPTPTGEPALSGQETDRV